MFKKETGYSLGQYIRSRKLTEIARTLRHSDETILCLAERYGFESQQTLKANSAELMAVVDRINRKGRGRIWFAGQGSEKPWAMKREMLSPGYTTRFADLPRVR